MYFRNLLPKAFLIVIQYFLLPKNSSVRQFSVLNVIHCMYFPPENYKHTNFHYIQHSKTKKKLLKNIFTKHNLHNLYLRYCFFMSQKKNPENKIIFFFVLYVMFKSIKISPSNYLCVNCATCFDMGIVQLYFGDKMQ